MKIFNYPLARIALRRRIIKYFERHGADYPAEYAEKAASLRHSKLSFLPTELVDRYADFTVEVMHQDGLPYVMHNGKKLFFRKGTKELSVVHAYRGLVMEQDQASPHCYRSEGFELRQGDILLDMGAAEGIFTLDNIEKIGHAYLFECEEDWIGPLNATFAPYKDKITIVKKYISDTNDDQNTTIDQFVGDYKTTVDFIKMDIEGMEIQGLQGGAKTIAGAGDNLRLAVCCYHRPMDCQDISDIFAKWGYSYSVTKGLLCYKYQPYPPYFRRGVVCARRG